MIVKKGNVFRFHEQERGLMNIYDYCSTTAMNHATTYEGVDCGHHPKSKVGRFSSVDRSAITQGQPPIPKLCEAFSAIRGLSSRFAGSQGRIVFKTPICILIFVYNKFIIFNLIYKIYKLLYQNHNKPFV